VSQSWRIVRGLLWHPVGIGRADLRLNLLHATSSNPGNHKEYEKSTGDFVQMNALSDSMLLTSIIILYFLMAAVPGFGI
jgi:hypothetical protein